MGPDGIITVVWVKDDFGGIETIRRSAAGTWEPVHELASIGHAPRVAAGAPGRAVVPWEGADGNTVQIQVSWR